MIIEHKRLKQIFNNARRTKIAIVGDVMLDKYITGDTRRISPEAPVPVLVVENEFIKPGGAANVAWNIKDLGATPFLFSVVGDDNEAHLLINMLKQLGICEKYLLMDKHRTTTTKTRIIARGQQVVRVDKETPREPHKAIIDELVQKLLFILPEVQGLVISDYGKGVITADLLRKVVPEARRHKVFVAVDPKERHFKLYRNTNVITPNTNEASGASGIKITNESILVRAGKKLLNLTGAENVLITRGAEGMTLFTNKGDITHFPALARQVYDVTGAGDTVVATFALISSAGGSLKESAIISSHAAGIVVGKTGTATASPEEIEESMKIEILKRKKPQ